MKSNNLYWIFLTAGFVMFSTANAIILNTEIWGECVSYIHCATGYMYLGICVVFLTVLTRILYNPIKKWLTTPRRSEK